MGVQWFVLLQSGRNDMEHPTSASEWIGTVAERLQRQWPTIDPARLDDLAADLWQDQRLRALRPELAADDWLRPVSVSVGSD
jgi:hypothetical protein